MAYGRANTVLYTEWQTSELNSEGISAHGQDSHVWICIFGHVLLDCAHWFLCSLVHWTVYIRGNLLFFTSHSCMLAPNMTVNMEHWSSLGYGFFYTKCAINWQFQMVLLSWTSIQTTCIVGFVLMQYMHRCTRCTVFYRIKRMIQSSAEIQFLGIYGWIQLSASWH